MDNLVSSANQFNARHRPSPIHTGPVMFLIKIVNLHHSFEVIRIKPLLNYLMYRNVLENI